MRKLYFPSCSKVFFVLKRQKCIFLIIRFSIISIRSDKLEKKRRNKGILLNYYNKEKK